MCDELECEGQREECVSGHWIVSEDLNPGLKKCLRLSMVKLFLCIDST